MNDNILFELVIKTDNYYRDLPELNIVSFGSILGLLVEQYSKDYPEDDMPELLRNIADAYEFIHK